MPSIKRPKQIFDLCEIIWADATDMEGGWKDTLEPPPMALALSVGFLIHKDKNHYVLALDTDENGHHNGRSQIPTGMVKKVKILRKADK